MKKLLFTFLTLFLLATNGIEQVFQNIQVNPVTEDRKVIMGNNLISVHDDVIYILWTDQLSMDGTNSYVSRSVDGGNSFTSVPISDSDGQVFTSMHVSTDGTIHTTWTGLHETLSMFGINYAKSVDGGLSFSSETTVSEGGNFSVVKAHNNDIYVMYFDVEILEDVPMEDWPSGFYFTKSVNGGANFSAPIRLNTPDLTIGDLVLENPNDMAVTEDGTIYVAWSDNRNSHDKSDVFVAKSVDGGLSFSTETMIPTEPDYEVSEVSDVRLVASENSVYVAFRTVEIIDDESHGSNIMFARSTNGGVTFPLTQIIYENEFGAMDIVRSDAGNIFISFNNYTAPELTGVHVAVSTNDGDDFKHYLYINDEPAGVNQAFLFVENATPEKLHIAWNDDRNDTGNNERDIFYAGNIVLEHEVVITGNAGWRMLSMPAHNTLIKTLDKQNWLQGVWNSSSGSHEDAPNFYFFENNPGDDTEGPHPGWMQPLTVDWTIPCGKGFIWYLYENTKGMSQGFPFTLKSFGGVPQNEVQHPVNNNTAFVLLGNPYPTALDVSQVHTWGDLQNAPALTWDPALQGGLGDWKIITEAEPFTGFFVEQSLGASGVITIPFPIAPSSVHNTIDQKSISLMLSLTDTETGITLFDENTSVLFSEGAKHSWDKFDAQKLIPLRNTFAILEMKGNRNGHIVTQSVDARPLPFTGSIGIPIDLHVSNMEGNATISAAFWDIPENWAIALTDHLTNSITDLKHQDYHFMFNPEEHIQQRFLLHVDSGVPLSMDHTDEIVTKFALHQNYPNPFNPATTIRYDIESAGMVHLVVYDINGRKVATLVNEYQSEGMYQTLFDGNKLSSGLYIVSLQINGVNKKIKITLIK